jgi:hypothetical protein
MIVIGRPPMDEISQKREIQKLPMRKLLAVVKQDIRRTIKASASPGKPLKKK